jgi:hypothetical protein
LPVQIVKFLKPTLSPLINNTLPANGETNKPVANVIISENVKPVIINTDKVKPLVKKATVKVTKPKVKEATVKVAQSKVKEATVKEAQSKVKEATVKVAQPKVKEATVKAAQPKVKEETVKVVKPFDNTTNVRTTIPQVKEVTAPQVIKPLAKVTKSPIPFKETTGTAAKPLAKEATTKVTTADKNDSATRYYKYPVPPKPLQ